MLFSVFPCLPPSLVKFQNAYSGVINRLASCWVLKTFSLNIISVTGKADTSCNSGYIIIFIYLLLNLSVHSDCNYGVVLHLHNPTVTEVKFSLNALNVGKCIFSTTGL